MQVLHDQGNRTTIRMVLLVVTGSLLGVFGAAANTTGSGTGSQGGPPVMLILGVVLFLAVLIVLGVLGYLFMNGSLSIQDVLPGNTGASPGPDQGPEEIRKAVMGQGTDSSKEPPGPSPPQPSDSPSSRKTGGQERSGAESQEGEEDRSPTGTQTGAKASGQRQEGNQVSMDGLRRDTARIRAVLKNRKNIEQRDAILQELDNAMDSVDRDDLQEARDSLDRIRQMLNMRD
ncbi:MAG: hypothetical protein SVU32_07270 [Candidatus Nanohaloarchaea archaeon]|nr:hypothetical protein [Candidatus Nanohaloarchaea archaeon]